MSLVSNLMMETFRTGKGFLFFAVASALCLIYLCKYMIETKGKTRQAVIQNFDSLNSSSWLISSAKECDQNEQG